MTAEGELVQHDEIFDPDRHNSCLDSNQDNPPIIILSRSTESEVAS